MDIRKLKDITGIKVGERVFALHSRNLEVAELDEESWNALDSTQSTSVSAWNDIVKWNYEPDTHVRTAKWDGKTHSLAVNVTQLCNLRCTYCAAGGDGTYGSKKSKVDLTKIKEQLQWLLVQMVDGETFTVTFFGGEPLLHPEAISSLANHARLLTAGRDIKLQFSIVTNGTLINQHNAELLAAIGAHVTVSIDGSAENNDRTRPTAAGKPSTQKTIDGLHHLMTVRERLGSINVNGVFGKHNMKIREAYEFYRQFNFDSMSLIYAINDEDEKYSRLYIDEMKEVLRIAAKGGEQEVRKLSFINSHFSALDNQVRTVNHCGAGKTLLHTDTKGELFGCAWLINDKAEKIGENVTLLDSRKQYANDLVDQNNCHSCWARFLCGGGCMFINKQQNGDKFKKDKNFCERTRALAAFAIHYYGMFRSQSERTPT